MSALSWGGMSGSGVGWMDGWMDASRETTWRAASKRRTFSEGISKTEGSAEPVRASLSFCPPQLTHSSDRQIPLIRLLPVFIHSIDDHHGIMLSVADSLGQRTSARVP